MHEESCHRMWVLLPTIEGRAPGVPNPARTGVCLGEGDFRRGEDRRGKESQLSSIHQCLPTSLYGESPAHCRFLPGHQRICIPHNFHVMRTLQSVHTQSSKALAQLCPPIAGADKSHVRLSCGRLPR